MKKFLSLVLALVMAMSLVTVSAGAKDFNDGDKISGIAYEEAVNVMSEMGIIDGYGDGNFQPQGTLTRGAAAKIIACMMLGKTTAEALGTQAAPFKDVPVGSTFAGYIAYCSESGIIDGYSDGTFRPGNSLTGFAFLKMLLTALGYDSDIEGYANNPNWTVNVAGRAKQIGLLDGNEAFVGTRAATREEACLYAVNALQATLVEYKDKGGSISVGDITINTGASNATYVVSNVYDAATSIDDYTDNENNGWTVEFAEKYQPDLERKNATDAFGRPAHTWTWKNNEVGTYVNYDELVAEYTTKITGKDLFELLGRTALDECSGRVYIYVDGETERSVLNTAYFTENQIAKSYDETVGETGKGVLTQVFHDTRDDEITIAIINTYLAKAAEDYDEKNDEVDLDVFEINNAGRDRYVKADDEETMTVSGEDFDIAEVADGDLFLVTVADGEIQTMAAPEILAESTITSFSKEKYVVSGGTQYDYADTARYDDEVLDNYTGIADTVNLKDLSYNIILDPYGYMIGIELVEDPTQYLFLTGLDLTNSYLGARNAQANVIFADGKMDEVTVNLRNSRGLDDDGTVLTTNNTLLNELEDEAGFTYGQINTWCTYTVDSNGVYSLRRVATVNTAKVMQTAQDVAAGDVEINKGHVSLDGAGMNAVSATNVFNKVYGNDETVYIVVDNTVDLIEIDAEDVNATISIIDDVDSVITGVANVDLEVTDLATMQDNAGNVVWPNNPPAAEIYTLHDDDGYIIATVVIGEDQGTTTNYAYIIDDVTKETYDATTDQWSWTRPAVVNGKIVDLQEVGDNLHLLDALVEGEWYEVRYDANGNVRKVSEAIDFTDVYVAGSKYVGNSAEIQDAIDDDVDTILVLLDFCRNDDGTVDWDDGTFSCEENGDTATNLSFKGNTLFIDTLGADPKGFSVSPNVNVVLSLANKNHAPFDDVDDSYTGSKGLEKALRNLDTEAVDVNGDGLVDYTFEGHLSFVMEDGVITSIVLNDYTGPRDNTVSAAKPVIADIADEDLAINAIKGDAVTMSITVNDAANDREYGTLSYQWYKVAGGMTTAVGTNSPSLTITANETAQYYCVVTNYDNGKDITGEVRTTETSETFTVTVGSAKMNIQVNYALASGKVVLSGTAKPVSADAGTNTVTVKAAASPITGTDGKEYTVVDGGVQYVDFVANTTKIVTFTVEEVVEAPKTMDVMVTFMLEDGKTKIGDSEIVTVNLVASGKYADLMSDANKAILAKVLDANYKVVSADPVIYTDSIATATVTVARKTVEVNVPTGLKISWDAVDGIGAGKDQTGNEVEIPVGVQVTVELADNTGEWNAAGSAKFKSESLTSTEDGQFLDSLDDTYGYVKVTVNSTVDISNASMTGHSITATIEGGFVMVPTNETDEITISLFDEQNVNLPRPITIDGTNSATATTENTFTCTGGTAVEIKVNVTVASQDTELTVKLGPSA